MATCNYYTMDWSDGTWVDASNTRFEFEIKVNDYDGWDAPNNQEY